MIREQASSEGLAFEDALGELEGVVEGLERGDLDLARAIASYGRGVELLARCHALLGGAERSVSLLDGVDAGGEPRGTPFDAPASGEPRASAPERP